MTYQGVESPDIIVTSAAGGPPVPARADIPAVVARNERMPAPGTAYDLSVYVWNLGRGAATGVRVWVPMFVPQTPDVAGPLEADLGGLAVDLPERTHRLIRVLTFDAPEVWSEEQPVRLVSTADCFTDPTSGDLSPGADRQRATSDLREPGPAVRTGTRTRSIVRVGGPAGKLVHRRQCRRYRRRDWFPKREIRWRRIVLCRPLWRS